MASVPIVAKLMTSLGKWMFWEDKINKYKYYCSETSLGLTKKLLNKNQWLGLDWIINRRKWLDFRQLFSFWLDLNAKPVCFGLDSIVFYSNNEASGDDVEDVFDRGGGAVREEGGRGTAGSKEWDWTCWDWACWYGFIHCLFFIQTIIIIKGFTQSYQH